MTVVETNPMKRIFLSTLFIVLFLNSYSQGFRIFGIKLFGGGAKKWYYTETIYDIDADGDPGAQVIDSVFQKAQPEGYTTSKPETITVFDCNDTDGNVNHNASEVFNGVDDNCNGQTDEGFQVIRIETTGEDVKQAINGYCNELWQWDRSHKDIDVNAEPFNTNYLLLHPQYGTFNNAMANVHFIAGGTAGSGYNFSACKPYPNTPNTCSNTPSGDCSADGIGCFPHSSDFYAVTSQYFAAHDISLGVNINPYVSTWIEQRKYIDVPLSYGVNVTAIAAGNELAQDWYANKYYFPNGGTDYKTYFNKLYDSVKRYYPSIPVLMWSDNVWTVKGTAPAWNTAVASARFDGLHMYGQTKDITNRIITTQAWTESQAVDSVLVFQTWLTKWDEKIKAKYGNTKVYLDVYGTNPQEANIGGTFLGELQTAFEQMCLQKDTNIAAAQEYRTRSFNLGNNTLPVDVQMRQLRGLLYGFPASVGEVFTDNPKVAAIASNDLTGASICLVLNFSDTDYPANVLLDGTAAFQVSIEGYYVTDLLTSPDSAVHYMGGNVIKAKSLTLLTIIK